MLQARAGVSDLRCTAFPNIQTGQFFYSFCHFKRTNGRGKGKVSKPWCKFKILPRAWLGLG